MQQVVVVVPNSDYKINVVVLVHDLNGNAMALAQEVQNEINVKDVDVTVMPPFIVNLHYDCHFQVRAVCMEGLMDITHVMLPV